MNTFDILPLNKQLRNAIDDLGFVKPTPIQEQSFPVVRSGSDVVGIAQTGTGKTLAYMLPILQDIKFQKIDTPRVLILVPTRELVLQVVERVQEFSKYMNLRVLGVYGGTNINTQKKACALGVDVVVATPGRLYDLAACRALQLKTIKQLVIDEVDVMLDLGFRIQLANIFSILPERRQNIMFSATMTVEVDALIDSYFIKPKKISIALSGTPLDNISQQCYRVRNFYTKLNLLNYLLLDKEMFSKVLVFVPNKKHADMVFEFLEEQYASELCVIHSNKTQNYRIRSIKQFDEGINRILVSTDVMARGLDLDKITHVINFNTPVFSENYMHRIGRTGRAEEKGNSILFYTDKEEVSKNEIESLMDYMIPQQDFPTEVEENEQLLPEERDVAKISKNRSTETKVRSSGFHEKKEKNKKVNTGGSYRAKLAKKYKKSQTKGDIIANRRSKKRRK
ncbi:MAG: DEAD/DEAH box helicase [Flavobacteriales bacterium]|nr:DEAD/DEAH box helicase [Flavobacteriales bacterium]MDG1396549.1 DEAD/DEAH box helicase [Flavobacteriales bacterium]